MLQAVIALLVSATLTAIVGAVVIVALAVCVLLFLRWRSRKQGDDARVREELAAMEREAEFSLAVDQTPHSRTAAEAATNIAAVLQDFLWLPVLAVYAGREGDANLTNILPATYGALIDAAPSPSLPSSLESSLAKLYSRPSTAGLDTLAGESSNRGLSVPTVESLNGTGEDDEESTESSATPASEAPEPIVAETAEPVADLPGSASSSLGDAARDVFVFPWRGPFDWTGLIVTSAPASVPLDALERYREPLARLTGRVGAALEIESEAAKLGSLQERVSRTVEFSRSLISCQDEPAPLVSITREVARLVGADSAALWRVERGAAMIRMVASHGLRSAEFLPLPMGQGLTGTVAESGEVLAIEDAPGDPRCIFPREARESGIASYAGAAVKSDGIVIAVIEAHNANRHVWTGDQQRSLEAAASIIAELVKTTDARGDRLKVESAYLGLSEALQRLHARDEVLEAVVEVLGHALGVSRAVIVELGEQGTVEPVKQEYRLESVKSALGATFAGSLADRVKAAGAEPIAIDDSREQSLAGTEAAAQFQILSELALPVRVEGTTCAIVYLHQSDRLREWQADEIEFADRVARQLGLSLTNVRAFETASAETEAAREKVRQARETTEGADELRRRIGNLEREVSSALGAENQARTMLAHASALEGKARADADMARRGEAEARQETERLASDCVRAQTASQQLLEINRLKSEFIVSAGREMDASLQSVLGLAEMLEQGAYGHLDPEQLEAVRGIYNWGRRVKSDVDWLIEYGSARTRRLEQSGESSNPPTA
ncbi:MAG TPA: GAF domain-containing protein [Blastocatellia bacterium]|nr:GAF domain-containing protein [Blastocatellia bacterium]